MFGRDGSRLGNGMGYYDRLLAACRDDVVRVAVTRSDLVVASVPVDEHDVAMTHLATELGVTIV